MAASPTKKAMDEVPNHDSQHEVSVTPAKYGLADVFLDDNFPKQFLFAQLSTTKKHIKNE